MNIDFSSIEPWAVVGRRIHWRIIPLSCLSKIGEKAGGRESTKSSSVSLEKSCSDFSFLRGTDITGAISEKMDKGLK